MSDEQQGVATTPHMTEDEALEIRKCAGRPQLINKVQETTQRIKKRIADGEFGVNRKADIVALGKAFCDLSEALLGQPQREVEPTPVEALSDLPEAGENPGGDINTSSSQGGIGGAGETDPNLEITEGAGADEGSGAGGIGESDSGEPSTNGESGGGEASEDGEGTDKAGSNDAG